METIRWVGLDLGTTTGYCYHDLNSEDEIVLSGVGEIVMTKLPMPIVQYEAYSNPGQ